MKWKNFKEKNIIRKLRRLKIINSHNSSLSRLRDPPPNRPLKKLSLGGSGMSWPMNKSPIISVNSPLKRWKMKKDEEEGDRRGKKSFYWNSFLPKLAGNGKLLDLGRRREVQTVASVAEAKRFRNSVKKMYGITLCVIISYRFVIRA